MGGVRNMAFQFKQFDTRSCVTNTARRHPRLASRWIFSQLKPRSLII
jgi:hypothetical protein